MSVYVGLWKDYSQQGVHQATLTLPLRWGNVLSSTLTLLISLAGGATWVITAYVFHQLRVRIDRPTNPLQLQVQALLRNDSTPTTALVDSFLLTRAWFRSRHYRPWRPLLPIALAAATISVLFALAGVFVSEVATRDEASVVVLYQPAECGGWDFDWSLFNTSVDNDPLEQRRADIDDTINSRLYAKWFYGNEKPLAITSSKFPVKSLPYDVRMGPCPFEGVGRCLSNDTSTADIAMTLDSGLVDSHTQLGVNAMMENRVNIRNVLTCAPINVTELVRSEPAQSGHVSFNWEPLVNANITFAYNSNPELGCAGYEATCWSWQATDMARSWPNDLYPHNDSDISICFVAPNSVTYREPVYDPLFFADGSRAGRMNGEDVIFGTDYFRSIACLEKTQFCNPNNGRCTNTSHIASTYLEAVELDFNEHQWTVVSRTAALLGLKSIGQLSLATIGSSALLAREAILGDTMSLPLPLDQWQQEVKIWFATKLSALQANMAQFQSRLDLRNPTYAKFFTYRPLDSIPAGPQREAAEMCCSNQKIATTGTFQNFQFFGVMVVIAACIFLILTSLFLEFIVGVIRERWVSPEGRARQLARDHDNRFWLMRMALQGAGVQDWRRSGRKNNKPLPIIDQSYEIYPPCTGSEVGDFYKPSSGVTEAGDRKGLHRAGSEEKN